MICIALLGPPGVGKSAVARILERTLPARRFDIVDFYKPGTDFSDTIRWNAFLAMLVCVRQALERREAVLLEAFLFRPQRQNVVNALCRDTNSRLFTVLLTAHLEILLTRVARREPGHLTTTVSPADIVRFADNFRDMTADLIIDTSERTVSEVAATIQEAYAQWRRKA